MDVVEPTTTIQLPDPDDSVSRQDGEGWTHWAGKASIVAWLESLEGISGRIETERKVEDLIADVKCTLDSSVKGIPDKCVFEIQTRESSTNILQRIRRFSRHGYTVFYIYPDSASNYRRHLADRLVEHMSERPFLGRMSFEERDLQLGTPLAPGVLNQPDNPSPWSELYVPTHKRSAQVYDHGDFIVESVITGLVSINGRIYSMKQIGGDSGQRTLPIQPDLTRSQLYRRFMDGAITRVAPVRGTPRGE